MAALEAGLLPRAEDPVEAGDGPGQPRQQVEDHQGPAHRPHPWHHNMRSQSAVLYCQLTFIDGLLIFAEHVIQRVHCGGQHHQAPGDNQPHGDQGRPGVSRGLVTEMLVEGLRLWSKETKQFLF